MAESRAGDGRQESFSGLLLRHRGRTRLTQRELAERSGVSLRTVQGWETGLMYPGAARLQSVIVALLGAGGLTPGHELPDAEALWMAVDREAPRAHPPFDRSWFATLLTDTTRAQGARVVAEPTPATPTASAQSAVTLDHARRLDWGDAPAVVDFVGRSAEVSAICDWVLKDRCHMIGVFGMGGIGKTSVAAKAGAEIAPAFERVYWRSLRNAPLVADWLADAIGFLSGHQVVPPEGEANQIAALLVLLREQPGLLVFDNFETLLEPGQREARYRDGLGGYAALLRTVGESNHQSCMMITSREAPPDWATLAGGSVRWLELGGLGTAEGQVLLANKQLWGNEAEWADLIGRYGGNGLALKVVGESIRQVFGGDIAAFLAESASDPVFGGIRRLLTEQFDRSSEVEQNVLRMLAVEREPVTISQLITLLAPRAGRGALVESIEALRRRSLAERAETPGAAAFTLQPVVLEYVTDRLVADVRSEIAQGRPTRLTEQPLIRAQAKDYIRQSQERLIGEPILRQLKLELSADRVDSMLTGLFDRWRTQSPAEQGYGPGNAVNLLRLLRGNLRQLDLSGLALREADLSGVEAQDTRLASAHLVGSVLTEALNSPISLALSNDGAVLAVGTWDGELWLWRVADRTPLLGVRTHVGPVHAVALSGDGRLMATGSEDGTAQIWDAVEGRQIATLEGHTSPVYGVALSENGQVLASGSFDGTIRVWEVPGGRLIGVLAGHSAGVWSVSLSPDGQLLASGAFDGGIRLWDVPGLQPRTSLDGHASPVWSLKLSSDARLLASGSEDGVVRLWDVISQQLMFSLQGHTGAVRSVSLSRDSQILASASWDQTIRLWRIYDGRPLRTLEGHSAPVRGVALSADGRLLASASQDDSVRTWEVPAGRPLATMRGYADPVYGVALSTDGQLLASGNWDGTVRLWDVTSGNRTATLKGHTSAVYGVALSADARLLASASWDRSIRLWDLASQKLLFTFSGHTGGVRSVALSSDGALLASGSWDTTIRLWDTTTGRPLAILRGHTGGVRHIAISADNRLLVSGGLDGDVRTWAMPNGEPISVLQGHANPVYGVALSADGKLLASGGWDGQVYTWGAPDGPRRAALSGHRGEVRAVALSANGHLLASGGFDGTVRLWDTTDEQGPATLVGHTSPVYGVSMSADGRLVASSSFDGTVRIWDVSGRTMLRALRNDRPYERMDISGLSGVTAAQYSALLTLGAVEKS